MRHLLAARRVIAIASTASAQDWTQWRGPTRDGVIPAAVIPKQWPKSVKRSWQVEIGEGYSSPVVANGRAFLHSRRDPDEIVTAIDLATGKVVWQQKYTAVIHEEPVRDADGEGPELDAARRRQPAVHARRHRHPHRVECRRRHDRLAAGLLVVDRHLETVLRHRDVADARGRRADRAGRQRRARRPRARARSGDRQGAVVVEGPRARVTRRRWPRPSTASARSSR